MNKYSREVEAVIKAQNLDKLKKKLKLNNYSLVFECLFDTLSFIVHKSISNTNSFDFYDGGFKIFDFMDDILKLESISVDLKKLNDLRTFIIGNIKKYDKKERIKNKKVYFLKESVNRIENIQLNFKYNVENNGVIDNYNIIKHILINIKDVDYSNNLVSNYTYLINAYNINNGNILNDLIDSFLVSLEKYKNNQFNYDLSYFEFVIYEMLHTEKIRIDKNDIYTSINKVTKYYNNNSFSKSDKDKIYPWINHMINILSDKDYNVSVDVLDSLYDVKVSSKYSLEDSNFIIINRDYDVSNDDYIISIDCEGNFNRDDALSIKKINDFYRLKIYIADPNSVFRKDSLLMKDARRLSQSIYLCDRVINMFPDYVISDCLSLDENRKRFSRVYIYDIDECGRIIDFKLEKKIIRVNRNLTYDGVDNIFVDDIVDSKLDDTIKGLFDVKSLILNNKVLMDSNNNKILDSNNMLEVLMVFNNQQIAQYFSVNKLPFIYRGYIQKNSSDLFNEKFCNFMIHDENVRKMIKSIGELSESAFYSDTISHHDGLKVDYYCNSTSPNRRYADIVVNECEDNFYFSKISDKECYGFEDYLKKEIEYLNQRNFQIADYYSRYARALSRNKK